MHSSVSFSKSKAVVFSLILLAANPWSVLAAFNARLQGQSRGSAAWIGGNLQGWRDLDEIPCRVHLTGGPANNKTITIEFDRLQGRNPGIENLSGFTPSANVVITSQPVLSAPRNFSRWTYTFTVKVLDKKPGCVKFTARLALGAHRNGGSSVGMRGSPSLGNLQIHKPAPCAGQVFNIAPVANPDSYPGRADEPLMVSAAGVLANDTDTDNDPLTAILVTVPAHGTVTLNANGSFQYVPATDFTGSDSFTYKANDGLADSQPATVTLTIRGVTITNRPPVVGLINPANGAIYITGMAIPLVAEAFDPDGTIMQVDFFSHDVYVGSSATSPYSVLLTNAAAGEYVFRATATDNASASAVSDPVAVTVLDHLPFVAGPFRLNRQTGLFEQTVTVTNPTPLTFEGIRLWITNVRSGATVWNATGLSEGVSFIQMLQGIPSGTSIDIGIEYYTPDIRIAPQPSFLPEVL